MRLVTSTVKMNNSHYRLVLHPNCRGWECHCAGRHPNRLFSLYAGQRTLAEPSRGKTRVLIWTSSLDHSSRDWCRSLRASCVAAEPVRLACVKKEAASGQGPGRSTLESGREGAVLSAAQPPLGARTCAGTLLFTSSTLASRVESGIDGLSSESARFILFRQRCPRRLACFSIWRATLSPQSECSAANFSSCDHWSIFFLLSRIGSWLPV